ncbi:MAG: lytic transglycosylase domain-containing protein [Caulobacterales bacterium]|nr:lytic transglycosylase domain-containing protein [Caulobacterales bacterium]
MTAFARKLVVGAALAAILGGGALAQSGQSDGPQLVTTPQTAYRQSLSDTDASYLSTALTAARAGDGARVRLSMDAIQDPVAKKVALWALADGAPDSLSFFEADSVRRDLNGWPRGAKRQATAEKLIETSGMPPERVIAWFGGTEPTTVQGAMALAGALRASGRTDEARNLVRRWWRESLFDAGPQAAMRARFGDYLTMDDHLRRADVLLYGQQGPAAREMVASLPESYRPIADARIALRSNSPSGNDLIANMTPGQRQDPGLIYEQAAYFQRRGLTVMALQLARGLKAAPTQEVASRAWTTDRRKMVVAALAAGDYQGAYGAAANTGLIIGPDAAEAEFYAGWIALSKLKNPSQAAGHFARLAAAGTSPITQGRALYWQGRAAEALGDKAAAQAFYLKGAQHITVFYGQLAAERAGLTTLTLPKDPPVTQADRARFEGRELVRALRLLYETGNRDTFKVFALHIDDTLPTAAECALLVDLARSHGDPDTAMRAVRTAAQRGMTLPERGYPILISPNVPGGAEPAFVFSITRQESNFDPRARSAPGARGLMQLMPATGASTARSLGEPYSVDRLFESDFNMKLGARYLGDMISQFGGSYVMAAAAYNAGPGRPGQWAALCGDPRGAATDPLDYIECIPFVETRNYVMRTLETTQVYRARIAGGSAPLTLSNDLKRGSWSGYTPSSPAAQPYAPGAR